MPIPNICTCTGAQHFALNIIPLKLYSFKVFSNILYYYYLEKISALLCIMLKYFQNYEHKFIISLFTLKLNILFFIYFK